MTQIIAHPEYFPEEGSWHAAGRSARSLRALQQKLGPDVTLLGYYPDGAPSDVVRLDPLQTLPPGGAAALIDQLMGRRWTSDKVALDRLSRRQSAFDGRTLNGKPRKYDRDTVLGLWAEGATSQEIADRLGFPSRPSVSHYVLLQRDRGDPRAKERPKRMNPEQRSAWVAQVAADVAAASASRKGVAA